MPTPSSDAPDPGSPHSPRFYPFSCPDPDEPDQTTSLLPSQTTTTAATTMEYPPPPAYSAIDAASAMVRPGSSTSMNDGDSRSVTMSPGPAPEEASSARDDVDMEREHVHDHDHQHAHGTDGMSLERDRERTDDRHKPTEADEDMSRIGRGDGSVSGGAVNGGNSSSSREVARTVLGRTPGRRKARAAAEPVSPMMGETYEVEMGGAGPAAGGGGGGKGPRWVEDSGLVGLGLEYSHMRVIPSPTSVYLQPGSRFVGTQQSERQRYEVEVEIKYVDMRESFLCGYLKIQGLTKDHPMLTTYFEGEIIGPKYGFITQHQGWGATEKIDLSHWSKFTAFRPFLKQARKGGHPVIKDVDQRENVFMRWKEHFLVPDHRVRTINGASFEGFYYICFNQVRGEVSGIYFHSKSEKFQQLELKHVEDRGCFASMEFR